MKVKTLFLFLLTAFSAFSQSLLAPSPDRPGAVRGDNVGAYNVTNSFETGYRFTEMSGDADFFRNTSNYGNGLRLFGVNFTANSREGHGVLFDTMTFNAQGFNDPYSTANLRVEKNDVYRYDMSWRVSNYFNLPLDNGASGNLAMTRRIIQDHDLTLLPAKWWKLKLGYSRNHQTGPQDSTYEAYIGGLARSVIPLLQDLRRDYNEYRLGAEFNFLGFRLMLSHQWEYNKDDSITNGALPGSLHTSMQTLPYQAALAVTYPPLVTAYMRSAPMHGLTNGWFGNLNRTSRLWAINSRMTYNKANQNTFYFEQETGDSAVANSACSNCGAGAPTTAFTLMPGKTRRPSVAGDVTLSLFPTRRLTIVSTTSAEDIHEDGAGQMLQVNYVSAIKNVYWNYRIGDERVSDALQANYRLTDWLGVNTEYRYTARWLINNLIRTGTTNSKDVNTLNDHMNTASAGIRLRPVKPLALNLDGTLGRDNAALTPIAPAHFHNIRARADYRPSKRWRLGGAYRQMYNLNAPTQTVFTSAYGVPPPSYYSSHSRTLSGSASLTLSNSWSLDFSYDKLHLDTLANLWAELPQATNPANIVSGPGYVSRYISNIHSASAMIRTTIGRLATAYAGYTLTHDSGDGRAVQDLGLKDPAASYLAARNTFPMTYQSPFLRVSVKVTPYLHWNAGWEFYRYDQQFALFGYQPYYRAHTGYSSISWSF
jgi:hypothetical protein